MEDKLGGVHLIPGQSYEITLMSDNSIVLRPTANNRRGQHDPRVLGVVLADIGVDQKRDIREVYMLGQSVPELVPAGGFGTRLHLTFQSS